MEFRTNIGDALKHISGGLLCSCSASKQTQVPGATESEMPVETLLA